MPGKILVDADISAKVAAGEFGEIKPVVQDRPQHAIGKAVVEFLIVGFAQIDYCIRNILLSD